MAGHFPRRMNLILALACDEAHVRCDDGKLDVTGIFNELGAPGFPAQQDHMTVVLVFEWAAEERGTQPLRADLIDDNNGMVLTISGRDRGGRAHPDQPPAQDGLLLPLENVIFPHAGRYRFRLKAGTATAEALPLFVATRP